MYYAMGALFGLSLVYLIAIGMIHVVNKNGLVMTRLSIRQAPDSNADEAANERALEYQRELEKKWLHTAPVAVIAIVVGVILGFL